MKKDYLVYFRRFKHEYLPDSYYFITYRIIDSATKKYYEQKAIKIRKEIDFLKSQPDSRSNKTLLLKNKRLLLRIKKKINDPDYRPNEWLKNKEIRDIIKENLHYHENKIYDLVAYSVMSNHVHIIIKPYEFDAEALLKVKNNRAYKCPLSFCMYKIKRFTGTMANKVLGRTGTFWRDEYYSVLVEDKNHLRKVILYTLLNPVKARLSKHLLNNPYNYLNPSYNSLLEICHV